jgi:flagellar FliJ protein
VLEIKEIEEKVIYKDLLKIQHQILETEKNISDLQEKISQEGKKANSLNQEVKTSTDIMLHYNYIQSLDIEVEHLKEHLDTLKLNESILKTKLVEKSREKKALERLKEIKYEEYKKEYNKEQQAYLDDVSIQNHRLRATNV